VLAPRHKQGAALLAVPLISHRPMVRARPTARRTQTTWTRCDALCSTRGSWPPPAHRPRRRWRC